MLTGGGRLSSICRHKRKYLKGWWHYMVLKINNPIDAHNVKMPDNQPINASMMPLNESNLAIFAWDGTTRYYVGNYNRRYGYMDRIGDRIFIDFDIQINQLGDLSRAPSNAALCVHINNLPNYITNQVSPIGMYNINLPSPYNQVGVGMSKIGNDTVLQLVKFAAGGYSALTKTDIGIGSAFIGGINYRKVAN